MNHLSTSFPEQSIQLTILNFFEKKTVKEIALEQASSPGRGRLRVFSPFSRLPQEIRAMIWRYSLTERLVLVHFREEMGFWTSTSEPSALRVSPDSRSAVSALYPRSFGNGMYPARIRFNFDQDILYLSGCMESHLLHFCASLTPWELASVKRIAISNDLADSSDTQVDSVAMIEKVMKSMPELQTIYDVHSLNKAFDKGSANIQAPLQLYFDLPKNFTWRCPCKQWWLAEHECTHADYLECTEEWDKLNEADEDEEYCQCVSIPQRAEEYEGIELAGAVNVEACWIW